MEQHHYYHPQIFPETERVEVHESSTSRWIAFVAPGHRTSAFLTIEQLTAVRDQITAILDQPKEVA